MMFTILTFYQFSKSVGSFLDVNRGNVTNFFAVYKRRKFMFPFLLWNAINFVDWTFFLSSDTVVLSLLHRRTFETFHSQPKFPLQKTYIVKSNVTKCNPLYTIVEQFAKQRPMKSTDNGVYISDEQSFLCLVDQTSIKRVKSVFVFKIAKKIEFQYKSAKSSTARSKWD